MSPLAKQVIEIPLAGGLHSKADPKVVPPGSLLALENGEFDELGAIAKRNGYTALTDSTSGSDLVAGRALHAVRDELVLLDGSSLFSYTPTAARWQNAGALKALGIRTHRVASGSDSAGIQGIGYASNIAVVAWRESGIYASVIDTQTGATIISRTQLQSHSTSAVTVVSSGAYIYVITNDGSNNLSMHVLNSASPTSFATSVLQTNYSGTNVAAVADTAAGTVVAAYKSTSSDTRVFKFNSGGVTVAAVTVSINPDSNFMLGVFNDGGDIYLAAKNTSDEVYFFARNSDLTEKFAPVLVETSSSVVGRFVAYKSTDIYWHYNASTEIRRAAVDSSGSVSVAAARWVGGVEISSEWLTYTDSVGTHRLIAVAYDSTASGGSDQGEPQFLLGDDGLPYASFLRGVDTQLGGPTKWAEISTGVFWCAAAAEYVTDIFSPVIVEVDFSHKPEAAVLGGSLHLTGGLLWEYDGTDVCEHGFLLFPDTPAATPSTSGGSLPDGVYAIAAYYDWIDARGQVHRGEVSVSTSATVSGGGGSGSIAVVVPTLRLTHKADIRVRIAISEVDETDLYVIDDAASQADNDKTVNSVTIDIEQVPDATDVPIYTSGGILDNAPPAPLRSIVRKGERLYGVDERGKVWFSRKHVDNEGVAFAGELLTADITEEEVGDTFRISEQDGALVVWGENSIQVITGDGPDDTGANSDLQDPRVIASDVGAVEGSPFVRTDMGTFFKADKGICLLSRSFQVDQTIGTPVETYKTLTMKSGVAVPGKNQIRFGHSDGVALVYDYVAQKWSTFTNHTQVDAVLWGGDYCLLLSDGTVWQQGAAFTDGDDASITMTITTPWIRLAGIQGFQRIWYASVLGEYRSSHTCTVTPYFDYSQTPGTAVTKATTTGTSGDPLQFRTHQSRRCQAVKFKIVDSIQAGTKESYSLTGLALEIGTLGGVARQAAANTI